MASIIEINIGDFLKYLWIDVRKVVNKLWFKINFKLANFGLDNAYQKRIFGKEKELYCFVCGDKDKVVSLSHIDGYDWDHKCDVCGKTFNIYKKRKVDCHRR